MRKWIVAISGSVLWVGALESQAATLRVPQQYGSIQQAVDAAAPGDTVLVGPGRYVENVLIQKSLVLKSSSSARSTVVDGAGIGNPVSIWGTGTENVTVSGFTLTGGAFLLEEPVLEYPRAWGGALFVDTVANATIKDNIVTGNRGCVGSGIFSFASNVVVSDNVVRNNGPMDWCPAGGVGIRVGGNNELTLAATVERNQVLDNNALGILVDAFDTVAIRGNRVSGNGVPLENMPTGAGIVTGYFRTQAVIADNLITRNTASDGAALVANAFPDPVNSVYITGNIIVDNHSDLGAGGEGDVMLSVTAPAQMQFQRNIVIGRKAGALVYCSWDNIPMEGNLIVNTDPDGFPHFCSH